MASAFRRLSVPRVRGDEPIYGPPEDCYLEVFPACAGMNRRKTMSNDRYERVPRVRGDEPQYHG